MILYFLYNVIHSIYGFQQNNSYCRKFHNVFAFCSLAKFRFNLFLEILAKQEMWKFRVKIPIIIMRKFREKNNANNFWTDRNSER